MVALACTTPAEPEPEAPTREQAEAALEALDAQGPAVVTAPPPKGDATAELVPVEIVWEGIGPLYKGFFSDRDALTQLSRDLAPWLTDTVQLKVSYNSQDFVGGIRVLVPPGALVQLPRQTDGAVLLQDLAPITQALATYRDDLGGRYDVRIQSFHIGLDFYRGPVLCRIGVAGTPPPDGTLVSPCVEINGEEVCGTPGPSGVTFGADAQAKLDTCLGS